jgi:hypothetical protein
LSRSGYGIRSHRSATYMYWTYMYRNIHVQATYMYWHVVLVRRKQTKRTGARSKVIGTGMTVNPRITSGETTFSNSGDRRGLGVPLQRLDMWNDNMTWHVHCNMWMICEWHDMG